MVISCHEMSSHNVESDRIGHNVTVFCSRSVFSTDFLLAQPLHISWCPLNPAERFLVMCASWVYVVFWKDGNSTCMEVFSSMELAHKFAATKIGSWTDVRAIRGANFTY